MNFVRILNFYSINQLLLEFEKLICITGTVETEKFRLICITLYVIVYFMT